MRKIIVPVSIGANAANAARYAADLASTIRAELHLVYVQEGPGLQSPRPTPDFLLRELRDSGYTLLSSLDTELSARAGKAVSISTYMETGDATTQLNALCRRLQPFLVVMGACESKLASGDTVRKMQGLPYPLLVVPAGASFNGVRQVVVACDQEDVYSGISPVLPFLKELSALLGAHFEVLHVVADGESISNLAQEYDGWKTQMDGFGSQLNVVRQSSIAEGIDVYLDKHPVDWLLMLPKKHALLEFHKSTAKAIVPHCTVPVMSVHE